MCQSFRVTEHVSLAEPRLKKFSTCCRHAIGRCKCVGSPQFENVRDMFIAEHNISKLVNGGRKC